MIASPAFLPRLATTLLVAAVCGCGQSAQTAARPSGAPTDPAFEQAKAQCTERAIAATQATNPQGLASKAALGLYVRCMEEKGYAGGLSGR